MREAITSTKNPRIKELRKLKEKKYRTAANVFLIEGLRFVQEALRQHAVIKTILVAEESMLKDLEQSSDAFADCEILVVSKEVLEDLSATVSPQGIMACVELPAPKSSDEFFSEAGLWFYLDEIRDPGNLGTIIRSAHAFDVDGLILSKGCADPYQDKVLRSTMGSIFRVPLLTEQEPLLLEQLQQKGTSLYLTDLQDAGTLASLKPAENSVIVIGNEARGVCEAIKALPHQNIVIPMPGGAESLNAAVAASLIMYELKGRS